MDVLCGEAGRVLDQVDESLEAFLRASVPLGAQEIDVAFDAPDRQWSAKLTRPTVNLFLAEILRSAERARTGMETVQRNGETVRRLVLPRIELRYVITAWTSNHRDERALLSGVMRTVLAHHEIPAMFMAEPLQALPPPTLLMARTGDDEVDPAKVLDGQVKPSLSVLVVTSVDIGLVTPAAVPATAFELRTTHRAGAWSAPRRRVAGEVTDPALVGTTVRSPHGSAVVGALGTFLVPAEAGDELVIDSDPPRRVTVPDVGGVRIG